MLKKLAKLWKAEETKEGPLATWREGRDRVASSVHHLRNSGINSTLNNWKRGV